MRGEQHTWYKTDYMYPLTIVGTIIFSIIAILGRYNYNFIILNNW